MIDRRKFLAGTGMVAAGAISRRLYAQAGPPRRGADEVLTLDLASCGRCFVTLLGNVVRVRSNGRRFA